MRAAALGAHAAKYHGVVLHEYSQWMLEELIGVPRDSWTQDVQAIEAGFAYYLLCSHLDNPRSGFIDLTRGTALMQTALDPSHLVGLRWATGLWKVGNHSASERCPGPSWKWPARRAREPKG
ncbi:hypothetical protein EV643_13813 [Kribbella sp. VKM Ac-2527]|uniref:Uncharacterized protein n=1 Tax=Kribbella caucasensis TaxID=2512215 RepID=A0A4R6J4T0_9ACTN|nr:hypothetical protein [Kribbella sp. VKM Ac-2527]TDO30399.1 hypothetical protein EV643_13813 [Kribbella sp. VKM Ac-2527]